MLEHLQGLLQRHRVGVRALADRGIDVAVGDIGAKAAASEDHSPVFPILAQLLQDRVGAPSLGWVGQGLECLFQRDLERRNPFWQVHADLFRLHIGAVSAVEGQYVLPLGVLPQGARKAEQCQRCLQVHAVHFHALQQTGARRLDRLGALAHHFSELDVGAKSTVMEGDPQAGLGVHSEISGPFGHVGQDLQGCLQVEFVRGQVFGQAALHIVVLQVGAVAPHPDLQDLAFHLSQRKAAELLGLRLSLGPLEQNDQAWMVAVFLATALVEVFQVEEVVQLAQGDGIQAVLQSRREVVVHQVREVVLHQVGDREGGPGRYESRALLEHVPSVLDGREDGGIGRGSADAPGLEFLDQGGLGEPGLGHGGVTFRRHVGHLGRGAG